ncbi:MAG: hypothetical protein IPO40_25045 [Fibrobacteres bacterium]|nr:hypothetical protein [Fibrobacterota bacterium]
MALTLRHQTAAQFAARFWAKLRAAYTAGDKITYGRMVWWLYGKVQAGDLTNNDVRVAFNAAYGRALTLAQWNTFVTNTLKPIRDRYQTLLDGGEL